MGVKPCTCDMCNYSFDVGKLQWEGKVSSDFVTTHRNLWSLLALTKGITKYSNIPKDNELYIIASKNEFLITDILEELLSIIDKKTIKNFNDINFSLVDMDLSKLEEKSMKKKFKTLYDDLAKIINELYDVKEYERILNNKDNKRMHSMITHHDSEWKEYFKKI
ncbi:16360_t:CDS:1 [Racocetra persica]|uniref:16360_t:CDS:1 n=1 Tax=Racocetra persica TaxID=160502 RepID=A0ACA9QM08_9GLOM|nr:16360_t:CDS:1 [Racocetra persica]